MPARASTPRDEPRRRQRAWFLQLGRNLVFLEEAVLRQISQTIDPRRSLKQIMISLNTYRHEIWFTMPCTACQDIEMANIKNASKAVSDFSMWRCVSSGQLNETHCRPSNVGLGWSMPQSAVAPIAK